MFLLQAIEITGAYFAFLKDTGIVLDNFYMYIGLLNGYSYSITLVNIPVEGIRLLDAVCLLLGTPFAVVWSQPGVVCSEKVTFDPLTR